MSHLINRKAIAREHLRKTWPKPILDIFVDKVAADGLVSGRFSTEDGSFVFGITVNDEGKCKERFIRPAPT
jgi:hypothetical protein